MSVATCPQCGGASGVIERRQDRRRRQCKDCGHRWNTYEVSAANLAAYRAMAKALAAEPSEPRPATPEERRRARALRRGVDVPPEMEEQWRILKTKGKMTNAEAAASLHLKYKEPKVPR